MFCLTNSGLRLVCLTDRLKNPTVTICNPNRIQHSKAEADNMTEELQTFLLNDIFAQYTFNYPWNYTGNEKAKRSKEFEIWRKRNNFTNPSDIYSKLGQPCTWLVTVVGLPLEYTQLAGFDFCGLTNGSRIVPVMTRMYGLCHRLIMDDSIDFTPPGDGFCDAHEGT